MRRNKYTLYVLYACCLNTPLGRVSGVLLPGGPTFTSVLKLPYTNTVYTFPQSKLSTFTAVELPIDLISLSFCDPEVTSTT